MPLSGCEMANERRIQFLVRFGYDGSRFHGLQPQRDLPTAGGALRARLEEAAGQRARALCFAARTDAGVHALSNVATFWMERPLDIERFLHAISTPRDDGLWLVHGEHTPTNVHARGSSKGKRYRYRVEDGCTTDETTQRYAWHIAPTLDVDRLRAAAAHIVGTHDFTSFRARRCSASSTVKTLTQVEVRGPFPTRGERKLFFIDLAGDAFLRKMIRILVGTLVEIGTGLREPDDMRAILEARDRQLAGMAAPARGLILLQVGMTWPSDGSGLIRELG